MMTTASIRQKRPRRASIVVATFSNDEDENDVETPLPSEQQHKRPRHNVQDVTNVLLSITPTDYARAAFKANGFGEVSDMQAAAEEHFQAPSQEMVDAHQLEVVNMVRKNDLEAIKDLHTSGKLTVNACNKFGESLLHIACHRGHTNLVRYMIQDMKINVKACRDDYHRTALHDACWTTSPAFDVVDILLEEAPEHLLLKDARGFTPFDYVRKQDHGKWLRFLWERRHKLRPTIAAY